MVSGTEEESNPEMVSENSVPTQEPPAQGMNFAMATPPDSTSASASTANTPIIFRFIVVHVLSYSRSGPVFRTYPPPASALIGPAPAGHSPIVPGAERGSICQMADFGAGAATGACTTNGGGGCRKHRMVISSAGDRAITQMT